MKNMEILFSHNKNTFFHNPVVSSGLIWFEERTNVFAIEFIIWWKEEKKWQDQNNARNIHLEDEKKNEAGRSFFQSLWKGISCWLLFHFIPLNLLFCVYNNGRICITSAQCSTIAYSDQTHLMDGPSVKGR